MAALRQAAEQVAASMVSRRVEQGLAFDPTMILMIVSVLADLVKFYQECRKTPDEVVTAAKRLGVLERWKLRRVVRERIADEEMHAYTGRQLCDSIAELGASLTPGAVGEMYDEV